MAVQNPFQWLPVHVQRAAFWPLVIAALVLMIALSILGKPLHAGVSPSGIVSFELAGTPSNAQRILEAWGPTGRVYAGLSLGLDYLFLVVYSATIALGCVLVSRAFSERVMVLSAPGPILAWFLFVAAVLDAVENYALIQVLLRAGNDTWPSIARLCAIPKFLIVVLGLLYVAVGGVGWLFMKTVPQKGHPA